MSNVLIDMLSNNDKVLYDYYLVEVLSSKDDILYE